MKVSLTNIKGAPTSYPTFLQDTENIYIILSIHDETSIRINKKDNEIYLIDRNDVYGKIIAHGKLAFEW
jgi:hypothetical protein